MCNTVTSNKSRVKTRMERKEFDAFGAECERRPGALSPSEVWWCKQYQWLKAQGYLLRRRYAPEWVPSWDSSQRDPFTCEDDQVLEVRLRNRIIDATRMSDGLYLSLKVVNKSEFLHHVVIGQYFMMEQSASHPQTHFPDESDKEIIVIPLLLDFTRPRFDTFGEVVECLRQLFEVNSDCMSRNIMMDAKDLYVEPHHPVVPRMKRDYSGSARHYTRTQRPPKYYFIDFGLSRRYNAQEDNPLEYPIFGGDRTVPEFQNNTDIPLDPFPIDVYCLGNTIKQEFLNVSIQKGFEFLKPLVDDMVQNDPRSRPTMNAVVERFELIRQQLSSWKLRSRVTARDEDIFETLYRSATHWRRRIGFIVKRAEAIPRLQE
ncbi:hypothetical protein EDD22DRAFT_875898 [Suillus occidentalis]|nr:hypothetical protein EDD22DRAFT_875898 [Suillus occidentalis]